MIYTHVAKKGVAGLASPLDDIEPGRIAAALEATRRLGAAVGFGVPNAPCSH